MLTYLNNFFYFLDFLKKLLKQNHFQTNHKKIDNRVKKKKKKTRQDKKSEENPSS